MRHYFDNFFIVLETYLILILEVSQSKVAFNVFFIELREFFAKKEAKWLFGLLLNFDLLLTPREFLSEFLLELFELFFSFDESADMVEKMVLG